MASTFLSCTMVLVILLLPKVSLANFCEETRPATSLKYAPLSGIASMYAMLRGSAPEGYSEFKNEDFEEQNIWRKSHVEDAATGKKIGILFHSSLSRHYESRTPGLRYLSRAFLTDLTGKVLFSVNQTDDDAFVFLNSKSQEVARLLMPPEAKRSAPKTFLIGSRQFTLSYASIFENLPWLPNLRPDHDAKISVFAGRQTFFEIDVEVNGARGAYRITKANFAKVPNSVSACLPLMVTEFVQRTFWD